ncbi:hypothetical protein ATANTOWER_022118 [Ataeniobius toweri]|uniref:Secreted protein n=1 Tax=Ataeniobius toweri TaxID=208326 RepID=A0ABU7AGH5_9TELE|nr:hypothetical protein [Ataeniobius toweri]
MWAWLFVLLWDGPVQGVSHRSSKLEIVVWETDNKLKPDLLFRFLMVQTGQPVKLLHVVLVQWCEPELLIH